MNPWPSYRTASISDAYKAYQLGAALAHPNPRTSRASTPGISRSGSSATLDEEEPYHLSSAEETDTEAEPRPVSETGELLRLPSGKWIRTSVYVRRQLAEIYEGDEEDDWRDPPVLVVEPRWHGEEGELKTPAVTWLGHAGALVRIPWKRKGRDGMCGVLFDPIFSYR
jgi:hypothetical protein